MVPCTIASGECAIATQGSTALCAWREHNSRIHGGLPFAHAFRRDSLPALLMADTSRSIFRDTVEKTARVRCYGYDQFHLWKEESLILRPIDREFASLPSRLILKRFIYRRHQDDPIIYKVNLAKLSPASKTLTSEKLFSKEYSIADVQFIHDGSILFTANRDNPYAWSLYKYSLTDYSLAQIASNVSYDANLIRTGNVFLFGVADEQGVRPMVYDPATGKTREFSLPSSGSLETAGKVVTTLKNGLSGVFLLERAGTRTHISFGFTEAPTGNRQLATIHISRMVAMIGCLKQRARQTLES